MHKEPKTLTKCYSILFEIRKRNFNDISDKKHLLHDWIQDETSACLKVNPPYYLGLNFYFLLFGRVLGISCS